MCGLYACFRDPHYLADAPKRIEFERKGNFTVVWTDKNGGPAVACCIM